jgi:hypothetical protein
VIRDRDKWSSVRPDRFNRRKAFMAKAVGG